MTHDPQTMIRFARALAITSQLYQTRMNALLAPHDLTIAQFGLLNHLAHGPSDGEPIADIARAVEVNQPAVTKIVQKFDRLGWLHITGSGRGRRVRLNDTGFGALGRVHESLGPDYGRLLGSWTPGDLDAFSGYLERLAQGYDANRL